MLEQVSEESSLLLVDLGLADRDTEPFFAGVGRFITLTFFSQPVGYSPTYKYHPFSFTCHSNIANRLYFLAYATTYLVESNNREFTEMMAWRPSKGMRENPRLPNNSCSNEVTIACQYPCIEAIQRPFLWTQNSDWYETPASKLKSSRLQEWLDRSSGL